MSSKGTVGDVYAKVIDEVCAASRVDFEEGGVELSSLDLLKSVWQKKISQLKVAQMPWEPKPEPAQAAPSSKPAPTLPSNGHVASPPSSSSTSGPQIKQDVPSYPTQQQANPLVPYPTPQFPSNRPLTAQERAAMNLHQAYGNRAGSQIAQLQQQNGQPRVPMPQAMRQQQQQNGPYIKQEDGASHDPTMQDYKPDLSQPVPIKSSQTDGSTDNYESEITKRRAAIAKNRAAGDRLMKAHIRAAQQELEGGGLLVPLDERQPVIRVATTRAKAAESGASTLYRAQGDAADDDEADEDAINSDLDDPDELDDTNQEEESVSEVMLCTYDKVQRVKNKWKCTLKDGILRVEGNEYVFHKGQGEFEW